MNYGIVDFVHRFIKEHVKPGDICIDATAGNGYDTKFLCELVGTSGEVIGMDIQEIAIKNTKKRLSENALLDRAKLVLDSHTEMGNYAEKNSVACIVFNLGYLPGGDHNLATKAENSVEAMKIALELLKKDGLLSVTIYSGKDSGFEERDKVLEWLKTLDTKKFLVIMSQYYNRPNHPPIPVQIVKLVEGN